MARERISVTHLTPAMAQLLSAHATLGTEGVPTLKCAFLVGDILTKRDAALLQRLAPNVSVINMYGTTETQRAVSYYVLPPISTHPTALASVKGHKHETENRVGGGKMSHVKRSSLFACLSFC